jgi:hypothetical protein
MPPDPPLPEPILTWGEFLLLLGSAAALLTVVALGIATCA